MSKYDGWALKSYAGRKPYLFASFFHVLRKDVIAHVDKTVVDSYKKWKRGHGKHYKIVKVKLVEVSNE